MCIISEIYSNRVFDSKTLKFIPSNNLTLCHYCNEDVIDVIIVHTKDVFLELHTECFKRIYNIDDIKSQYNKVCKIKNQKQNYSIAYNIVNNISYNDKKKLLKQIDMESFRKKFPEGAVSMALAQEVIRKAISEGFNIYYNDLRKFYSDKPVFKK